MRLIVFLIIGFFVGIGLLWIAGLDFPTSRGGYAIGYIMLCILCSVIAGCIYGASLSNKN